LAKDAERRMVAGPADRRKLGGREFMEWNLLGAPGVGKGEMEARSEVGCYRKSPEGGAPSPPNCVAEPPQFKSYQRRS
jgi:hypothetical protein